jgi:hypothetical protein
MLRYLLVCTLLVAFAMQTFQRGLIVLDYYANTASFAKDCENKARPLLHCNGKCQMMKKLKQEERKDQQNPERKSENKNETWTSASYFTTLSLQLPEEKTHTYPVMTDASLADQSYSIFHPPALV